MGMERFARDDPLLFGDPPRHKRCFGRRARAVVHRGVRDIEPEELADDGLELEDRLKRALRELRLIRRIRGIELASEQELIDRGRDMMRVRTASKEGEHLRALILCRELLEVAHERGLVEGGLNRELTLKASTLGDGIKELVERGGRDRLEHRADLFFGMGEVAQRSAFDALNEALVARGVEEPLKLCRIARADEHEPALAIRILVDRLGRLVDEGVDLDDLT